MSEDVQRALGRIEASLEAVVADLSEIKRAQAITSSRLRTLELSRARVLGFLAAGAGAGGAGGVLVAVVTKLAGLVA